MPLQKDVRIQAFGRLAVARGGTELDLGPPPQQVALAELLTAKGEVVSRADLIDALWGQWPPDTAHNQIHRHIGRLRRMFEPELASRGEGLWVLSAQGGYRLALEDADCDLVTFDVALSRARGCAAEGEDATALEHYVDALQLAQQPLFAGLSAARHHRHFQHWERRRIELCLEATDVAINQKSAALVLRGLERIALDQPLMEPVQAALMRALSSSGRRADALALFEACRRRLDAELGTRPGDELLQAHRDILRLDAADGAASQNHHRPAGTRVVTLELPPPAASFTGREAEIALLDSLLAEMSPEKALAVVAVTGAGRVGKTAFVVHWAHRAATHFPQAVRYLDLHGFDLHGAVDPLDAMQRLLRSMGFSPLWKVDYDLDAVAATYRSLIAHRRLLLVLDNARDSEHVRPLLPASPGCFVVVTSRNRLTGLVAHEGARALKLTGRSPTGM